MATSTLKNLNKEDKDEFSFILLGCGIFTLALVIIDFFTAKWGVMPGWVLTLVIVFHGLTALSWVRIIQKWKDPKYDYWRKVVIAAAIAAILVIMFHRAGWLENKAFEQDVEKAKQEAR
jgi:predicted ferric reductase